MTKITRVNKYKDLRENIKSEVSINRNSVVNEEIRDDDFLSFIDSEQDNEGKKSLPKLEDTSIRNESFDTRLNILNQIRDFNSERDKRGYQGDEVEHSHLNTSKQSNDMTLMQRLSAMSPKEDVEQVDKKLKEKSKKKVLRQEVEEEQYVKEQYGFLDRVKVTFQDEDAMENILKKTILCLGVLFVSLCAIILFRMM